MKPSKASHSRGQDWTREEVTATIVDYFQMLDLESKGITYNKTEHNAKLREQLTSRSKGAVELKHQNISAILHDLGLPWISGYKPARNAQTLLREAVLEYISVNKLLVTDVLSNLSLSSKSNTHPERWVETFRQIPTGLRRTRLEAQENRGIRLPRKLDYADIDDRNRKLGYSGEEFALNLELDRLSSGGRADLCAKVRWVSHEDGDGIGYDIISCDFDDSEIYIEVKTTNGGPLTPFLLTRNELDVSKELGTRYRVYRIYNFNTAPRLYVIYGPLSDFVRCEPVAYKAYINDSQLGPI